MRILYINHYAGSPRHGMEYRPYYLAREWVQAGHEVKIVAADQSHIRARQPDLRDRSKIDETIDGIQYTWLRTHPYRGNGVGRVRNMGTFVRGVYLESRQLATAFRPDIVIASSTYPMDIWPAHRIAKLSGAKLLFEIHDLWPLTPIELGGMSRWHPFIMLVQTAENYVYRHADAVVSMLPKVHDYVKSRGRSLDSLHIVPNGVDPREWAPGGPALAADIDKTLSAITDAGNFVVGYAGTHGVSNSLDTFLDAARIMRDQKVSFVLVGDGPEKAGLQRRAETEQLRNVRFIDPIVKVQIPALLQRFDIAYIGFQRQPLYRFGIAPNKLMDYMMAARPVLHAIEAGNDTVGEAGCGLTVSAENPGATAQGIRDLLSLSAGERQAIGLRGKEFVMDNHTYPILSDRFLAACRP